MNPKLEDLIDTTPLDLTDLDREYLTEGDDRLEDRDKYVRRSLEGTIQLCATSVASLDTKTTELLPEDQATYQPERLSCARNIYKAHRD